MRAALIYVCGWIMIAVIMATLLAAVGVTDAFMRSQPERWPQDARGAGTLGTILGVLMGLGLAASFEKHDRLTDVLVAGLGSVTLAGLIVAGIFALAWNFEPKAAPPAAGIVSVPAVILVFCGIRMMQPRRGDGTVS